MPEAAKGETRDELSKLAGVSSRNISDFVRAELALKAEPLIAARAKENLSAVGGDKKSNEYKESGLANLPEAIHPVNTRDELSKLAGVSMLATNCGAGEGKAGRKE